MAETSTAQQMLDQEMIARIGRRDQSAFSALYDRLSGPLYSLAMKMLGDPARGAGRSAGCLPPNMVACRKLRPGSEQRFQLGCAADAKPSHRSITGARPAFTSRGRLY